MENVSIVDVEPGSRDYTVVLSALFDRSRPDGVTPRVSRSTHVLRKVRRVQNCRLLRMFEAQRKHLEQQRGTVEVELTRQYAWHGSGKVNPEKIAGGSGFMMQVFSTPYCTSA